MMVEPRRGGTNRRSLDSNAGERISNFRNARQMFESGKSAPIAERGDEEYSPTVYSVKSSSLPVGMENSMVGNGQEMQENTTKSINDLIQVKIRMN